MSMAAGEYVSVHSQADTESADLSRERAELLTDPEAEERELAGFYVRRGLEPALAGQVAAQLMRHEARSPRQLTSGCLVWRDLAYGSLRDGTGYNRRRRSGAGRFAAFGDPSGDRAPAGRVPGADDRSVRSMIGRDGNTGTWGTLTTALAAVLAVGFLLRVTHLGSGIPFSLGYDEPAIMSAVARMLKSGDFNPHFFDYPSGYFYVQLGAAVVTFIVGAMAHWWNAVETLGAADLYLNGRLVTVFIGTATIALVCRAGLRWGRTEALAASALLAVMPMHVRESHFVLTDVPITGAAMLTLVLSLRAIERPSLRAFVWAGAAAGLAAGIKYNALMAFAVPLAAALAVGRGHGLSRLQALGAAAAACVVAFFVTTPFAIFDLPAFLNGFGSQTSALDPRGAAAEPSWVIYLKHFRLSFGWPASLLMAAGFVTNLYRLWRGPDRARWALLLAFPAAYFYLINGWSYMFARYALPLAPFTAIWGGIGLASVFAAVRRLGLAPRWRRTAVVALLLAALVPGAVGSVSWLREFGRETTQALAWKWVNASVWKDELVVSEIERFDLPAERYRAEYVRPLVLWDLAAIEASGARWVILSSDNWTSVDPSYREGRQPPAAYHDLLLKATTRKIIVPSAANPGPEIRILELPRR